jgi:hypothetical protein
MIATTGPAPAPAPASAAATVAAPDGSATFSQVDYMRSISNCSIAT